MSSQKRGLAHINGKPFSVLGAKRSKNRSPARFSVSSLLTRENLTSHTTLALIIRSSNATSYNEERLSTITEFQSLIVRSINATSFSRQLMYIIFKFQSLIVRSLVVYNPSQRDFLFPRYSLGKISPRIQRSPL